MNHSTPTTPDKPLRYMQATGKLPHSLTNDYLFKALLQKNKNVLKELVCSLLHLHPAEVERLEIKRRIRSGSSTTGPPSLKPPHGRSLRC